jgi:hypothetical protein
LGRYPTNDGADTRLLVEQTDRAEVWVRQADDGPVYEAIWPESCRFATFEEAVTAARTIGSHIFLGAGEVALIARGVDEGDLAYEIHVAETWDRRYVGCSAHLPGDVLVYNECLDHLDEALQYFLGWIPAPGPEPAEERDRWQQESVSTPARDDIVIREGTRVRREEFGARDQERGGRPYVGSAVVAECATLEKAQARFWDCVAGLWRVAAGLPPDPAVLGVAALPVPPENDPVCEVFRLLGGS